MAKILVLDDEPASLEVLALFLRTRGHDVATSTTGRGALDRAQYDPPDLLIADYFLLDDYDGGQVARELRSELPALEVMIISGMMLQDVREAVQDIVDVWLMAKPLDLRAVERAVNELTARERSVTIERDAAPSERQPNTRRQRRATSPRLNAG